MNKKNSTAHKLGIFIHVCLTFHYCLTLVCLTFHECLTLVLIKYKYLRCIFTVYAFLILSLKYFSASRNSVLETARPCVDFYAQITHTSSR